MTWFLALHLVELFFRMLGFVIQIYQLQHLWILLMHKITLNLPMVVRQNNNSPPVMVGQNHNSLPVVVRQNHNSLPVVVRQNNNIPPMAVGQNSDSLPVVVRQNNNSLTIVLEPVEAQNIIRLPIVVEP
jgi:hypothetical protein